MTARTSTRLPDQTLAALDQRQAVRGPLCRNIAQRPVACMEMVMRAFRTLIAAAVLALAMTAPATGSARTTPYYSPATLPILPYRGMYYEAGRGGTGLTLDVDDNGAVFAVFYTYSTTGQPYYYLMQGQYQPNSDQDRLSTGVLGTLETTPYIAEGGECVGAGCAYKSPVRTATTMHARIVWTTPRVATLTLGSQTWHLHAAQYSVPGPDPVAGHWFVNEVVYVPNQPYSAVSGAFTLAKTSKSLTAANFSSIPFLSPNSTVYDLTWDRLPPNGFKDPGTGDYFALYDPDTDRLDIVQAKMASGSGPATSIAPAVAAFLQGPELMRGRHEFAGEASDAKDESDYSVQGDVTLTRSPDYTAQGGDSTTSSVVDIPVSPGVTQRILYMRPTTPIATIVALPGGQGVLGIQDDGNVQVPCFPPYRTRKPLADMGIASALVDKASDGSVYGFENVAAVVRWVQQQANVPVWIVGGSASTNPAAEIVNKLPVDDRIGAVFFSADNPKPTVAAQVARPALVIYNTLDTYQRATSFFASLSSAPIKKLVALTNNSNEDCGRHLFEGLDTEFANNIGNFIQTNNGATGN